MDTNQLIEAIARAVESAKPVQEICLWGFGGWAACMTKAEWSGWMQAIGSVVAIVAAVGIGYHQSVMGRRISREEAWRAEWQVAANGYAILSSVRELFISLRNSWINETDANGFRDTVEIGVLPALAQLVRSVPLMQLPDPMAAGSLVGTPEMMDELATRMKTFVVGLDAHKATVAEHDAVLGYFGKLADRLSKAETAIYRSLWTLARDPRRPKGPIPFEESIQLSVLSGVQKSTSDPAGVSGSGD